MTATLLSPMVLFFALGALAAFARSDLTIPEAAGKAMAIYLMVAIGIPLYIWFARSIAGS